MDDEVSLLSLFSPFTIWFTIYYLLFTMSLMKSWLCDIQHALHSSKTQNWSRTPHPSNPYIRALCTSCLITYVGKRGKYSGIRENKLSQKFSGHKLSHLLSARNSVKCLVSYYKDTINYNICSRIGSRRKTKYFIKEVKYTLKTRKNYSNISWKYLKNSPSVVHW